MEMALSYVEEVELIACMCKGRILICMKCNVPIHTFILNYIDKHTDSCEPSLMAFNKISPKLTSKISSQTLMSPVEFGN